MVPNVEDVDEIVIGKRYSVPVVIRQGVAKHLAVVPVIGPQHEDAEFIGFPARHWHPDRRFVSDAWLKDDRYSGDWNWSTILTPYPSTMDGVRGFKVSSYTKSREPFVVDGGRRVMTCKRMVGSFVQTDYSGREMMPPWLNELETAYKDTKLRKMICPHRGISCVGVIPEADGGIVCVGHGLKWNPETGELISRIETKSRC